ncbi:response regulator receiver domain-containing protein [Humibacillus xanthopallidus]|uniref:histidine kinase n=1 Tax=Humibacillus xanthopallidus TaxID=412689 RepID=A0A543PQU6_9MICO|nr:response regulator receiver domain-containing protein [Humibacillus xanthopallidus]
MGRFAEPSGKPGVDPVRALEVRLGEVQQQFRATSDILRVLTRGASEQTRVFDALVDNARRLLHSDVAQIHLLEGDEYRLEWSSGHTQEFLEVVDLYPVRRDNRGTLVGRIGMDRTAQQIKDVLADPDYVQVDLQKLGGYRSILGAPMVVDDEVVGTLTVWRTEVDPFDERAAELLTTFAEQAALALRHVELFSALESRSAELARKVDQLEALADVGEAISSTLVADEVLTTIVSHAVQLSSTDGGSLMEYDESTGLFGVRAVYGTGTSVVEALRSAEIHIDRTWVGRAARDREVLQIADLDAEPLPLDPHLEILHASGWRSLVAIPLVRPDRVVGALVVRRLTRGAFSEETCDLLSAFASQSAVALTNARLYQQLERQSRELAEASRHKSEFLASMSHELRTPLNAVIGFSEVLLERMFGELNDRQEDYLRDIHSAGRHLLALLGDILDLSKIEAGRMELDLTTFPMDDILSQAISLVRERALSHGLRLTLDSSRTLGIVTADELRLKQVLLNLLSNAVKFTPDGGRIDVHAWRHGDVVEVTVTDTGVGVDPADQERIFDSFQQGERSASTIEGTGLGLTLSRRIIELHGGRLWLSSSPGEGSTFGISIPQPRAASRAGAQDRRVADEESAAGPTIVVIEDDPRSAELVELHLRAAGLRVRIAATGETGLELVRAELPVAVVLDIHLPGMNGWEVLSLLKSDTATAAVPVVVVSVEPERGRGFALGATEYLVKPVSGEHLLAAVTRLLPRQAAGDEPATTRLSVVVVDDDPLALKLVRSTLEPLGWEVHTCAGGQQAADVVRAVSPSVVVMDLLMPQVDGFAVIDELRPDRDSEGPPIVVLTAKSLTPQDRSRLEGRIAFVAEKAGIDLPVLARRLAAVASDHEDAQSREEPS